MYTAHPHGITSQFRPGYATGAHTRRDPDTPVPSAGCTLTYGFFAGGFTSTYTKSAESIASRNPASLGFLLGFMAMGRGIGSVACGPLSAALMGEGTQASGKFAWEGPYANLVIFTGVTTLLGASSWVGLKVPEMRVWRLLRT